MEERNMSNAGKVSRAGLAAMGIFVCNVSAAGVVTNSNFPNAIATVAPTSSVFTLTHNLALTADSYQVFTTVTGTAEGEATVTTRAANAITITPFDESATPALADLPFSLMLVVGDGELGFNLGG